MCSADTHTKMSEAETACANVASKGIACDLTDCASKIAALEGASDIDACKLTHEYMHEVFEIISDATKLCDGVTFSSKLTKP